MALLKDLIVNGIGRFIGVVHAPKFITDGGTNSLFVKGDGTLDSNSYLTLSTFNTGNPDLAAIEALSGTSGVPKKTAANTWTLETDFVTSDKLDKYEIDYSKEYLTFEALEDTTFTFSTNALQYSLDGGTTWTTLAANTASPTITAGNKILWKQTGLIPNSSNGIGSFSSTGGFKAYGNIMSLYYGDNFIGQKDLTGKDYAFYGLFLLCSNLVDVKYLILPATTLAENCYVGMFAGCTSLITVPELPATTMASGCYGIMFYGCSSLTVAPELPATTLAEWCYGSMFLVCTSLTKAPELPATTLVTRCYNCMFQGCTSLITAPELLATTLVERCYQEMFKGCSSLNYIKCLATDISAAYTNNATLNWVLEVASSGVFIKDSSVTIPTGTSGVPNGWNIYSEAEYEYLHKYQLDTASSLFLDLLNTKADKSNTTAGTYKSVTVNNQGIVTAGTNPTTLSGYGITDAVTLTGQQTISGLKTFSSGVKLLTASAWDNADRGIPFSDPSDTTKIVYTYTDSNKGLTYNPNTGALKVGSIVKRNGTSSQFLKADGSVDNNEYINTSSTAQSKAGNLTATKFITSGGTSSLVLLGNGTLQAKDSIELYEAYLKWGGKDFSGRYGPIDAAMVGDLGANRFAFGKVAGISIEYSRDGGNTWIDYEAPDSVKGNLFANKSSYIRIGKASSESPATTDYQTRVTITLSSFRLYTVLNKFVIYVSTSGSTYNWCTIMGRLRSNYDNNVDSWSTFKNKVPIDGWSGYNVINYPNGITFGGNSSQVYLLRFIFGCDGAATSLYPGMIIYNISAFGGMGWTTPSYMATNGHLYSYDYLQNATFPANITATAIKKSGGTSSLFLKADGSVDSSVYAPLASPALTGTPTAPTASLNTNTTLIATTAFVTNAVLTIMNASPATLLVLNDLATALGNDPNLATTLLALIAAKYTKPSGGIPQSDLAEPLVHLTLEEYDELSSAEKNNGTWYFIEEE